jgi:hypothetical protein
MKPRDWKDLVRAIYEPAEIEALLKAGNVRNLLAMASLPGMPQEPFETIATEIAADPTRSDRERVAARQALRSRAGREEQEQRDAEKARVRAEFDALPFAPAPASSDAVDVTFNPFVDVDDPS